MSPALSEPLTPSTPRLPSARYSKDLSSPSIHDLSGLLVNTSSVVSGLVSVTPKPADESSRGETIRHAMLRLDARQYQQPPFALGLLTIVRKLRIAVWSKAQISPEDICIHKISGALTNAVFFVSCKTLPSTETLLLRVYGPSTGSLLSRNKELQTLHMISSRYNIGPRVYGTFENGRIEEYFHSVALTAAEIRDPQISGWIAARMAELHTVDITTIDEIEFKEGLNNRALDGMDPHARQFEVARSIQSWFGPAERVLALPGVPESLRGELDLARFRCEWDKYLRWVFERPKTFGMRRVFAHNDAQHGNLLRLKEDLVGIDKHRQIIVVDFEYAAANPAAYDIANHFHEWTTNYHGPSPHKFNLAKYPSPHERRNFYKSYIKHAGMAACVVDGGDTTTAVANLIEELDKDVEALTPASHAGGVLWGIIQAREDVLAGVGKSDFDYISYARGRMVAFRRALKKFGIIAH